MTYRKPDYNDYVSLGDCPNCRHGLMWMNHNEFIMFLVVTMRKDEKKSIPKWYEHRGRFKMTF